MAAMCQAPSSPHLPVKGTAELPTLEQPELEKGGKEGHGVTTVLDPDLQDDMSSMPIWGLVALFSAIIAITFTTALQVQVMYSTLPYVYSDFSAHSLIPTTNIVSSIVSAVLRLPLSKVLDLWGRTQGFTVTLVIFTVGVIVLATCQNVFAYAAASVIFWTGFNGLFYVLYVIIADNFSLKNRGFMFGLYNSPYLITTWIGAPVASRFLEGAGWRWSFGAFAIAAPLAGVPLIAVLVWFYRSKQLRQSIREKSPERQLWQKAKSLWIEFDCIGLLLLAAGCSLLLLPLSLYANQGKQFASPSIIAMLVIGGVALVVFVLWERYFAPKSFLPFPLLANRTVLGASISSSSTYLVYYTWYSYFSSSLQVVQNLDITRAGYVANIHSVGWVIAGVVAGAFIKITGRYKWICLFAGWPLQILAMGLMFHLSKPDAPIGLIIMAQIFLSVADGLIYLSAEVAVLAVVEHEHVATVLAVFNMFTSIFQAIGSSISAAIWTKVFPRSLAANLPASAQGQLMEIYSSLYTQLSFDEGSPERRAIADSYSQAFRRLFTVGLALTAIGFVSTVVWRDVKIGEKRRA